MDNLGLSDFQKLQIALRQIDRLQTELKNTRTELNKMTAKWVNAQALAATRNVQIALH